MKKVYEKPTIKYQLFNFADIITSSPIEGPVDSLEGN